MENKKIRKGLLIACALILFAAAGLGTASIAYAEQNNVGNAEISAIVRDLDISWTSGAVHIEYHSGDTVLISEKADGAISEDLRMRWRLNGDKLIIEHNKPGLRLFPLFSPDKVLTVTLPKGTMLKNASIRCTSGDLNIPALYADTLKMESTSGDIRAAVNARIINSELTSGDIELQVMSEAEEIRIETTSGQITLESAWTAEKTALSSTSGAIRAAVKETGELKANSTSGDIHAVIGQGRKTEIGSTSGKIIVETGSLETLKIHATSGNVTAYLPVSPGFTAKIETASGRIEHQLPLTRQGKAYIAGDGSGKVEISTTSGNVTVIGAEDLPSIKK